MGHITHHKKGHGGGNGNTLAEVMAGCTVRARLRLTDGGVALDWTDGRVAFRDIAVWSDARQGVIAHPAYSIDADDPTLLVVEHTTSVSDLPGIHRLVVTVSFAGWTAAHAVAAYVLSNNLVYGGANPSGRETETELEVRLHDVSTTFLQRLIDQLLALRWGENGRITALETLTRALRSETDALTERMDAAEGRLDTAEDAIGTLTEGMKTLADAVAEAQESVRALAEAAAALAERLETDEKDIQSVADGVASLGESKQDRLVEGENITIQDNVISAAGADLSDYYTKEEVDEKIADAGVGVEKLTADEVDGIWDEVEKE